MTKMTKNILIVGGVAIVGYLLYKKYGNKSTSTSRGTGTSSFTADEDFFSVSGTRRTRAGITIPDCPNCSKDGKCLQIIPRTEATISAGIAGQKAETDCVAPTQASARR